MKKKTLWTTAVLILALLVGSAYIIKQQNHSPAEATLPVNFFMPERFWSGVDAGKKSSPPQGNVHAMLVPHHLIAGGMISGMFEKIDNENIRKVIIVGPNHYEAGIPNIQYDASTWNTPIGTVPGIKMLKDIPHAYPDTMVNEHSIAGLVPYIAHYVPRAKVYSLILKRNTTDEELEALAQGIADSYDSQTLVIASVDFSHYLPYPVAERNDALTRASLLHMDEKILYTLSNDYLDSPASLATLMKVCKKLGHPALIIDDHSNSAVIFNDMSLASTTSYFTGYC